jgi:alkanesulfonate monooxygenase SsuD/methylene tetrahydromethanopterin reductase-like flavin-dependent oxidoreductase (luciferase family)
VADDDATAERLAAPARVAFRRLRAGRPAPIPTVEEALAEERDRPAPPAASNRVIVGGPDTVRERFDALLAASGADELMTMTTMHGLPARIRSYELLAGAYRVS